MQFPFKMLPFQGTFVNFSGGVVIENWIWSTTRQWASLLIDPYQKDFERRTFADVTDGFSGELQRLGLPEWFFILEGVLWCRNTKTNKPVVRKKHIKETFLLFFWLEEYCDLVWMFCGREFVKAKIHSAVALFIRNLFSALGMNFLLYTCKK